MSFPQALAPALPPLTPFEHGRAYAIYFKKERKEACKRVATLVAELKNAQTEIGIASSKFQNRTLNLFDDSTSTLIKDIQAVFQRYAGLISQYKDECNKAKQAQADLQSTLSYLCTLQDIEQDVFVRKLEKSKHYTFDFPVYKTPSLFLKLDFSEQQHNEIIDVPESPQPCAQSESAIEKLPESFLPESDSSPAPQDVETIPTDDQYVIDGFVFKMCENPLDDDFDMPPSPKPLPVITHKKRRREGRDEVRFKNPSSNSNSSSERVTRPSNKEKVYIIDDEDDTTVWDFDTSNDYNFKPSKAKSPQKAKPVQQKKTQSAVVLSDCAKTVKNLLKQYSYGNEKKLFEGFSLEDRELAITQLDSEGQHPYISLINRINNMFQGKAPYVRVFTNLLDEIGFKDEWTYKMDERTKSRLRLDIPAEVVTAIEDAGVKNIEAKNKFLNALG